MGGPSPERGRGPGENRRVVEQLNRSLLIYLLLLYSLGDKCHRGTEVGKKE
jgi:hypothetical protein